MKKLQQVNRSPASSSRDQKPAGKPLVSAERARELFSYNPVSGVMKWRIDKARAKAGNRAGTPETSGALRVGVDGRGYLVHRLVWLIVTGSWPIFEIDHRDGNPANNRWKNLRDVPKVINRQNCRRVRAGSTTGFQGVGKIANGRFRARITVAGKQTLLGCFGSVQEAHAVYVKAKRLLHKGNTL
jgi:hypothetical protein